MSQARVFCLFLLVAVSPALGQCPIWFRETDNGSCECGGELGGQIKCNKSSQRVSIAVNYCMTYDNISQELLTGYCNYPYRTRKCHKKDSLVYISLPSNITKLAEMCKVHNQQGLLCAQCKNGHGIAINCLHKQCTECNSLYATRMSLLHIILPITIYYILVVTCRLNCVSGKCLGYMVYCQSFLASVMLNNGFYYSIMHTMGKPGQYALHLSTRTLVVFENSLVLFFSHMFSQRYD